MYSNILCMVCTWWYSQGRVYTNFEPTTRVFDLALYTHRDPPMPCAALLASPLAIYTVDIANTPPKFAVYTVDSKICAFIMTDNGENICDAPQKHLSPFHAMIHRYLAHSNISLPRYLFLSPSVHAISRGLYTTITNRSIDFRHTREGRGDITQFVCRDSI